MAWILYNSQRINEAEQSAQEALRWKPSFAMARLMLAEIHRMPNKGPELVEDLTIYLRLDPDSARSGHARQALEETRQALEKVRTSNKDSGMSRESGHSTDEMAAVSVGPTQYPF